MTSAAPPNHILSTEAATALAMFKGEGTYTHPRWKSGKFLEDSVGLEIMATATFRKDDLTGLLTIHSSLLRPMAMCFGSCHTALRSRALFREHSSLTTPHLAQH